MNKVILIGRLTKDAEYKLTPNGTGVTSFTLAVNDSYNKDKAEFINCVAWKKTAEIITKYTRKGIQLAVEGRLGTRSYEGKNGKVYVTEVTVDNCYLIERMESKQEVQNPFQQEVEYDNNLPF